MSLSKVVIMLPEFYVTNNKISLPELYVTNNKFR